jgi:hypothetical protein
MKEIRLEDIVLDCFDEKKMQDFYAGMFGYEKITIYGHLAVKDFRGLILLFISEKDFVPPVWPEEEGRQQKELHFDFQTPNVDASVAKALALGAHKASAQFGGEDWTTMLDPSGHPFCLCRSSAE